MASLLILWFGIVTLFHEELINQPGSIFITFVFNHARNLFPRPVRFRSRNNHGFFSIYWQLRVYNEYVVAKWSLTRIESELMELSYRFSSRIIATENRGKCTKYSHSSRSNTFQMRSLVFIEGINKFDENGRKSDSPITNQRFSFSRFSSHHMREVMTDWSASHQITMLARGKRLWRIVVVY